VTGAKVGGLGRFLWSAAHFSHKMTMMTDSEDYEEVHVDRLSPEELVELSRYGEPAMITELVNQGLVDRLASLDSRGNSMLHMFAANGYLECIKLFLQHLPTGIDVQNNEGNTALHWACVSGQLATVQLLMGAGAKVAIENKAERTPICEAHKHQRAEILKYFEETLGKNTEETDDALDTESKDDVLDAEEKDSSSMEIVEN
jgi:ankyrin repeat protein